MDVYVYIYVCIYTYILHIQVSHIRIFPVPQTHTAELILHIYVSHVRTYSVSTYQSENVRVLQYHVSRHSRTHSAYICVPYQNIFCFHTHTLSCTFTSLASEQHSLSAYNRTHSAYVCVSHQNIEHILHMYGIHSAYVRNMYGTRSAHVRNTLCAYMCVHTLFCKIRYVSAGLISLLQRRPLWVTLPHTSERILHKCKSHIRTYSVSTHVHTSELILYALEHKVFTHTHTSEIVLHVYVSVVRTYSVSYTRTADVIE